MNNLAVSLVRTFKGRPVTLQTNGGLIYIAVHDSFHLAERKRWRERLIASHPDRVNQQPIRIYGRTTVPRSKSQLSKGGRFRETLTGYQKFLQQERRWYEEFNLEPPDFSKREREISEMDTQAHEALYLLP